MLPRHDIAVPADLHTCLACRRDFVVPVSVVDLLDAERCVVELRCNNCGVASLRIHDDAELMALDRRLDATQDQLREALEIFVVAEELDRVARFVRALHDDHILPEDF
jgi:hypothetical protein